MHTLENTGSEDIHVIGVELKDARPETDARVPAPDYGRASMELLTLP